MSRRRTDILPEDDAPKLKINRESIKESLLIFKYIRPYRGKFIIGLICTGLIGLTSMSFPYLLKKLIDSANVSGEQLLKQGPDLFMLLMLGVLTLHITISYIRSVMFTQVGEHAVGDLRRDIYSHIIMAPMDFFAQRRVGELSSRISADVNQVQDSLTNVFAEMVRRSIILVIGLILIFMLSVKLTLVMLSMVPVVFLLAFYFSRKIRKMARKAQDELAESGTIVQETFQGIANVKAFSNEWFEVRRFTDRISRVIKLGVENGKAQALFSSFIILCLFGTITLVMWQGARLMQQGAMSFGDLTAFLVYTLFVSGNFSGFAELYSTLQKTLGATQRVREMLSENVENVSVTTTELNEKFKLNGNVSFKNIDFSYPSRKEIQVLKNVSIEAGSGQQIAIVGPSGAGKSTITGILLRFYMADSGSLLFDGKEADGIPLDQLRKQMAMVPQDVHLFGGTIYENIIYGKPNATKEEVTAAAIKANAHEFIEKFPEGYDTIVGERGIKLSGGQRQRIAIARAILKDPVILILDEATSSLDSESEALVQEALLNLMKNRTSFVIAHRLSTIRNADKIIVLENGEVVESGTHQELIRIEEGLYKNMNKLQLSE